MKRNYRHFNESPLSFDYNHNTNIIAFGFDDGSVQLHDLSASQQIQNCNIDDTYIPIVSIHHRPTTNYVPNPNSFLCVYMNGAIKNWNHVLDKCLYSINEKRHVAGCAYHPRFPKVVTYGSNGLIYVYDEERRILERIMNNLSSHLKTYQINACLFHPNPIYYHEMITGTENGIEFWDLRHLHPIRNIKNHSILGNGLDIDWKSNKLLTCGGKDGKSINIFDYGTGDLIDSIETENNVFCAKFLNENTIVVSGSPPNLQIIDTSSKTVIASLLDYECDIKNVIVITNKKLIVIIIDKICYQIGYNL